MVERQPNERTPSRVCRVNVVDDEMSLRKEVRKDLRS